jgi:ABC-type lipoprotein export system ATPase subunit
MVSGGLTIAVIGADGSGKSTIVNELRNWLSWRLTVHTYYMGSQRPSAMAKAIGWGFRLAAYAYRACRILIGERNVGFVAGAPRLLQSLHLLAIARKPGHL